MAHSPSTAPRVVRVLLVVLGFLGLAVAFTWPLGARPAGTMTAQPFGDPLLNTWILAWGADRLLHGLAGFWNGAGFYPYANTLAYSEHLLGITFFTAPVQWATGNPVLVYNLAVIGATALTGIGTFFLTRALTGRDDVAWLAGVAFACSPYRVPQIYHLQMLMVGWMPLALLGLHRFLAGGSRWALAGFGAAFVLQAFSNGYFLYFTSIPVAIVVLHGLWRHRRRFSAFAGPLALAGLAILLALAPVAAAYLRVRHDLGFTRSLPEVALFSADVMSYAHVSGRLWAWSHLLPHGEAERELFPGLVVMVLALVALWASRPRAQSPRKGDPWRRTTARVYGAVLVTALLLSLGPSPTVAGWPLPLGGPYGWLFTLVPGFDGLRVPARMAMVVHLALAVLAAIGLAGLTRGLTPTRRRVAVGLATLIVAIEGLGRPLAVERFPSPSMAGDTVAYEWLRGQDEGPMLELPVGDERLGSRYLYRTLLHPNRIVNGYSGYGSALQDFVGGPPFEELDRLDDALAMARALGLRWIVVHPPLYDDPSLGHTLIEELRRRSAHVVRVETQTAASLVELRPAPAYDRALDPAWRSVPSTAFRASASVNGGRVSRALDGDRATAWSSEGPQTGQEWLDLHFDRVRDLARVRVDLDRASVWDYPRGLAIDASPDGESWQTVVSEGVLPALAWSLVHEARTPGFDVRLPSNASLAVRIRTTGQGSRFPWTINELRVWERPSVEP